MYDDSDGTNLMQFTYSCLFFLIFILLIGYSDTCRYVFSNDDVVELNLIVALNVIIIYIYRFWLSMSVHSLQAFIIIIITDIANL